MPMLDYKCNHCGEVYEILIGKDESICPKCSKTDQQDIVPPSCGKPIIR